MKRCTKVLDFGMAKSLAASNETATLADTVPGVLAGTLRYMSPEHVEGYPPTPGWDLRFQHPGAGTRPPAGIR